MDIIDKILKEALYTTFEVCKQKNDGNEQIAYAHVEAALKVYMSDGTSTKFTRTNDARFRLVKNVPRETLCFYMARFLINAAEEKLADNDFERKLYYEIFMQSFDKSSEQMIGELANCLYGRTSENFVESKEFYGFDIDQIRDSIVKKYTYDAILEMKKYDNEITKNVQEELNPRFKISNLYINPVGLASCREEVLSGRQIQLQNDIYDSLKTENASKIPKNTRPRREYNLNDEMFAVTDIGRKRKNQEDSVLILYHPLNSNYKMLVVADGMGGGKNGEMASQEIVRQMLEWFEKLSPEFMSESQIDNLKNMWKNKLKSINSDIILKYPGAGSTFVGAIVGEKITTIASIGDSRAYVLDNNNDLKQVTIDDNVEFVNWRRKWKDLIEHPKDDISSSYYKQMKSEKDELRYSRNSNIITSCIGIDSNRPFNVRFYDLINQDYKTLMLFSDGVTDCLSDNQIMKISRYTSPSQLAKAIVDEAISVSSMKRELQDKQGYNYIIEAGKDNTTAAVLDNKNKESLGR